MRKEIEFCSECGDATVEEVQECREPGYDTEYYCSRCGHWIRGSPQTSTVQITRLDFDSDLDDELPNYTCQSCGDITANTAPGAVYGPITICKECEEEAREFAEKFDKQNKEGEEN